MTLKYPNPIVAAFGEIVAEVSAEVLPELQEYDEKITGVRYDFGHWIELQETLNELDNSPRIEDKRSKYPVVFLLEDFRVDRGGTGYYGIGNFTLLIAVDSEKDLKSVERQEQKFDPILDPIYKALMNRLQIQPFFLFDGVAPLHSVTDRKKFGQIQLNGNTGNNGIDYIDAKEISNLRLTIDWDTCLTAINIFEVTN